MSYGKTTRYRYRGASTTWELTPDNMPNVAHLENMRVIVNREARVRGLRVVTKVDKERQTLTLQVKGKRTKR